MTSITQSIEVTHLKDETAVDELALKVYANQEPGFQIEGVTTYDDLQVIFGALRSAAPVEAIPSVKFNDASSTLHLEPNSSTTGSTPHIDLSYQGIAVHHNVSDILPITLATPITWELGYENINNVSIFRNPAIVRNVREGQTIPGRLTIFSEGNVAGGDSPFPGLLPTVHLFDRSGTTGPNHWTRYTTAGNWMNRFLTNSYRVKKTAHMTIEATKPYL